MLVYANSLANKFVWDDALTIVNNDFIKSWKNLPLFFSKSYLVLSCEQTYRPVVTFSYLLDYSIFGLNPFGYHLSSILLHIFNAILLFFFINLITVNKKLALLASLLFALHPVNTEAVNVISFREDLLAYFFYLSSIILYIKLNTCSIAKRKYLYISSLILFLLALLSKEMSITLPIVLILYDYFFVFQKKISEIFNNFKSRYLSFIFITLIYIWIEFFWMKNTSVSKVMYPGGNFYTNMLTMSLVFVHYIYLVFFPIFTHLILHGNSFIQHSFFIPKVFFSISFIIFCFLIAYKIKNVSKVMSFSIFWFFITLLPVSNIIPINNFIANRYLYLPITGFCLFMATFLLELPNFRIFLLSKSSLLRISRNMIIILLLFYCVFTAIRNFSYRNSIYLWSEMVDIYPDSFEAHSLLAYGLLNDNLPDKAIEEYNIAIALTPRSAITEDYEYLGVCYYIKGMLDQATDAFNKALQVNPRSDRAYLFLGIILKDKGLYNKAIGYFKQAIDINQNCIKAYNELGITYVKLEKPEDAKKCWQDALKISPVNKEILRNLSNSKVFGQ